MAAVEDQVPEEVQREFDAALEEYIVEYRALIVQHVREYEAKSRP